jgi:23S rRNA pseudouridine1911/1915/1917 synthase
MMAAREVRREYLALVRGRLPAPEGIIAAAVGRHPVHRKKMAVLAAGGRPAETRYVRMDTFAGFDYIRLELRTGRTHQIRVHMAHIGHPVLGDPVYGGRGRPSQGAGRREMEVHRRLLALMRRQALHAWRLRFAHPLSGAAMEFTAPLPPDMQAALDCLRQLRAEELSE